MKRMIVSLNSKRKSDLNIKLVGGKGSNLLRLYQLGFAIPPGFIITTEVLKKPITSLVSDSRLSNRIEKNLRKLPGTYAVRSSMVGEDQVNASFAGQLDTCLNVAFENVMSAVEKCYMSLYNPRVQNYVSEQISESVTKESGIMSIAVVIQQMVQAKYSGIAFTANPINGRREVVIEATSGLGEKIVSEGVTPDRYIVNARGIIEQTIPLVKDQPLLASKQILQLAGFANQIARHMHCPQDIEWVWDGDRFVFLQTRPITNLRGKNIYSSKLMADMSPGLLKPLQWSTCTQAMVNEVFGRLFTEIIGPSNLDFKNSIRLIHSRLYANVIFFEILLNQLGLPVNFFEMITRDETEHRRRPPMTLRFFYILIFRLIPFIRKYARVSEQMDEFITKQDGLLQEYREKNWDQVDIDQKRKHLTRLLDLHRHAQWNIIICSFNMSIRNTIMKKMVRRHAPSVESTDLIKGLSDVKGIEPNSYVNKLSEQLQQFSQDTIKLCIDGDSLAIRKELSSSQAGQKLLADFHAFMLRFGHYSANTTNFTEKRWVESTDMIWSMIGNGAWKKVPTQAIKDKKNWVEKKNEVLRNLSFLHKPVFRYLLKTTVRYLNLREKISLLLSEDTYQIRRLILSIGNDLVNKGFINKPDDVFYLYYDELDQILNQDSEFNVKDEIALRISQLEADEKIIPDDTICGDQVIPVYSAQVDSGDCLTGICGSSGFKKGYAYVVKNPDEVKKILTSDDILVVPFSHVGWTLLFANIGGIIAETGGQLSHTSIIAREYGIPAIVNVHGAIHIIQSGQPLTLDADNGKVYLKHVNPLEGG